MEKKNVVIAVLGGINLILAAAVIVLGFQLHDVRSAQLKAKSIAGAEQPAPERRHGPKTRRKVDIGAAFSNAASDQQDGGHHNHKPFHDQTPEEAIESAWQVLDTYRGQTPEEQAKTRLALNIATGVINAISFNAWQIVANMNEQQRADALVRTNASLENLNAVEQEVFPDMTEEEVQVFGGTVQALHNLSDSFLNALQ